MEQPRACAFCGHLLQYRPGDIRQRTYTSSSPCPPEVDLYVWCFLDWHFASPSPPSNCSVTLIPQLSVWLLLCPLFPCKPGLIHAFFFACFALFHFQNKLFLSSELCIPVGSHVCCCCLAGGCRAVLLPLGSFLGLCGWHGWQVLPRHAGQAGSQEAQANPHIWGMCRDIFDEVTAQP